MRRIDEVLDKARRAGLYAGPAEILAGKDHPPFPLPTFPWVKATRETMMAQEGSATAIGDTPRRIAHRVQPDREGYIKYRINDLDRPGEISYTYVKDDRPEHQRITVPELDEILGQKFVILDQGFVRVVDYMGGDASIVQAARISYGAGTTTVRKDRGLIRYLMMHDHTTPFEMAQIKLHIHVPMDLWRQGIRHRTACLAEGTEVYFDLPCAVRRGDYRSHKLKIEDIFTKFQPTRNAIPEQQRNPYFKRERVQAMHLRQVNEDTLEIQHTHVLDAFDNGCKHVYRIYLEDGKTIECTRDHRFLFDTGWATLKKQMGLHRRGTRAVWNQGDYQLRVNGTPAHQDPAWLDREYNQKNRTLAQLAEDSGVSTHTIRKHLHRHGLQKPKGGNYHPAWNKGRTYTLGPRTPSKKWRKAHRRARCGPASNFWRGGVMSLCEADRAWVTRHAREVHEVNDWTCQLCGEGSDELHVHHIIPVRMAPKLVRSWSNVTTLCSECHHSIAGQELEYVEELSGRKLKPKKKRRLLAKDTHRQARNKLTVAKLVRIVNVEYLGKRRTFDLEVEGPYHNFVANGIVTHNSVNEYSTRYSKAIDDKAITLPHQWRAQSTTNKQGSAEYLPVSIGEELTNREEELHKLAEQVYQERIDAGVAREQARKDLPLSTYTTAYWNWDLHNLLHFLRLRMDSHAQQEIRELATVIGEQIVAKWCPLVWEAFQDYTMEVMKLSALEQDLLKVKQTTAYVEDIRVIARKYGFLIMKDGKEVESRELTAYKAKLAKLGFESAWDEPLEEREYGPGSDVTS